MVRNSSGVPVVRHNEEVDIHEKEPSNNTLPSTILDDI